MVIQNALAKQSNQPIQAFQIVQQSCIAIYQDFKLDWMKKLNKEINKNCWKIVKAQPISYQ